MKRLLYVASLFLLLNSSGCLAYAAWAAGNRPPADNSHDQVLAKEKSRWAYAAAKDTASLGAMMGPGNHSFTAVTVTGATLVQRQYLAGIASTDLKSHEISDVTWSGGLNTVRLLTYVARTVATVDGRDVSSTMRVTALWVKHEGEWWNCFYQETLLERDGRRLVEPHTRN
ncbi:MAG TPA: nuclear transport factor 2 family protein [Thermoanaerobaculia bacterium]